MGKYIKRTILLIIIGLVLLGAYLVLNSQSRNNNINVTPTGTAKLYPINIRLDEYSPYNKPKDYIVLKGNSLYPFELDRLTNTSVGLKFKDITLGFSNEYDDGLGSFEVRREVYELKSTLSDNTIYRVKREEGSYFFTSFYSTNNCGEAISDKTNETVKAYDCSLFTVSLYYNNEPVAAIAITCKASAETVTKCDQIVKNLTFEYHKI